MKSETDEYQGQARNPQSLAWSFTPPGFQSSLVESQHMNIYFFEQFYSLLVAGFWYICRIFRSTIGLLPKNLHNKLIQKKSNKIPGSGQIANNPPLPTLLLYVSVNVVTSQIVHRALLAWGSKCTAEKWMPQAQVTKASLQELLCVQHKVTTALNCFKTFERVTTKAERTRAHCWRPETTCWSGARKRLR